MRQPHPPIQPLSFQQASLIDASNRHSYTGNSHTISQNLNPDVSECATTKANTQCKSAISNPPNCDLHAGTSKLPIRMHPTQVKEPRGLRLGTKIRRNAVGTLQSAACISWIPSQYLFLLTFIWGCAVVVGLNVHNLGQDRVFGRLDPFRYLNASQQIFVI